MVCAFKCCKILSNKAFTREIYFRNGKSPFHQPEKYSQAEEVINGLGEYVLDIKEHVQICDSTILEKVDSGDPKITQLNFVNFQPGSIVAIR